MVTIVPELVELNGRVPLNVPPLASVPPERMTRVLVGWETLVGKAGKELDWNGERVTLALGMRSKGKIAQGVPVRLVTLRTNWYWKPLVLGLTGSVRVTGASVLLVNVSSRVAISGLLGLIVAAPVPPPLTVIGGTNPARAGPDRSRSRSRLVSRLRCMVASFM